MYVNFVTNKHKYINHNKNLSTFFKPGFINSIQITKRGSKRSIPPNIENRIEATIDIQNPHRKIMQVEWNIYIKHII